MTDLKKSLQDNQVIVLVIPNDRYEERLEEMVSIATKTEKSICYVSLNKPYKTLLNNFSRAGIRTDNIFFVDSASGRVGRSEDGKAVFVTSPKAMTELSIVVTETIDKNRGLTIFDSLSTLLIYSDLSTAVKFTHFLITRTRTADSKIVFTFLEEDVKTGLAKEIGMFIDKIETVS